MAKKKTKEKDSLKESIETAKKEIRNKQKGEEDKTEISTELVNKLVDRLGSAEEEIALLRKAADKGRIERLDAERRSGKLVKKARLSFFHGKPVVGWSKVKDDVYFDEQGRLHEEQIINIYMKGDDDKVETKEIDIRSFSRIITKVEGEVVSESKDKDGNITYRILLPDGKEHDVNVTFIN